MNSTPDATVVDEPMSMHLDEKPASHWGTQTGLVSHAAVHTAVGQRKDVFDWGESLCVKIVFQPPKGVDLRDVGVAFP